jgi:HK97 family phage major capsid protein
MNTRNRVLLAGSAMPALALATAASAALALPQAKRPRAVIGAPRAEANPAEILADLQRTHATFKSDIDAMKGKVDALDATKIAAMNDTLTSLQASIDQVNVKLAAQQLNGSGEGKDSPERKAYAKAFDVAFRRGGDDGDLKALAVKASMSTQSDPDGGWMVPIEMDNTISRVLQTVCAMRGLAQVQPISTGEYKKLVSQGGATSGWVGETDARGATNTPTLAAMAFEAMELYSNPATTQTLLDDAYVNIGDWLAGEVSITFAEQEGLAFINGSGVKKPRGILSYTTVADANYAWGKIGYLGTGGAAFAADPGGLDKLISMVYALKQGYRTNASFLANRTTIGVIRQMKDSYGHYQWQPSSQIGEPPTLLGYPIVDDDNMDDLGANKYPVAFADFKRAYLIVDRIGTRVLRDPFSNKPYVSFYTTKRVGGGVQNFEAIKLLKCA